MRIIINGDDFGYDEVVNEAIANLVSQGQITSTTILANAPAVDDAMRRIPSGSRCSFGVHLNLTEFEPLTPAKARGILHECLDAKGSFLGENHLRSMKISSNLKEAFFTELSLQVEAIRRRGIHITHFDSHNHIHTIPYFFPILKRLQEHYGVRKVRLTKNIYGHSDQIPFGLFLKKQIWNCALRQYYKTTTTSGFAYFGEFLQLVRSRALNLESVELMVHPGHPLFQEDARLLVSGWQKEMPFKTQLITYHDL